MRRFLTCLALMLLALLCAGAIGEDAEFTLIAETDSLKLLLCEQTLETRVEDKRDGQIYSTKVMDGKKGNGATKNLQKSDMRVTYIVNEFTCTVNSMDSNSMSVEYGNYAVERIKNGFEIAYSIGNMTMTVDDLPKMIPVDKYNELLLPYWGSKHDKAFREFYRVVKGTMWVRTDDGNMGKMKLKNLYEYLYEVGKYTKQDKDEDNAVYIANEDPEFVIAVNPRIDVKIRFQLDGDDLVVSIPCDEIGFTEKNELTRIDILPYFLTATTSDEGYIFVPDGSGALIGLNNGKTMALSYTDSIYGSDPLKNRDNYSPVADTVNLPVYGIKTQDSATLAIIEKGAECATLFADISGRSDDLNRIYSYFTLRDIELISVVGSATATTPRYPDDVYKGDIAIRYKFLCGDEANAVGMADAYRNYLIERGGLIENEAEEEAPLFVELIGSVRKTKFLAGIPYESTVEATTLEQAKTVYDALLETGAKNIILMPNGIFDGGVWHESLNHVTLSNMGDEDALATLRSRVETTGGKLFPAANIAKVYSTADFSKSSQAARRQDNYTASVTHYGEPILARMHSDTDSFYISPRYLPEYVENVIDGVSELPLTGLRINDLAGELIPDYRKNEQISRIHATQTNLDALKRLSEAFPLVLNDPNDYALSYARYVTGLSISDNGHKVIDEAIPFMQWVLDGCVTYTAKPWNERAYNGIQSQLLYAVESKSAPYFRLTYENETVFLETEVAEQSGFFMTQYERWLDEIANACSRYGEFWALVKDARVAEHAILKNGVRKVVYTNGIIVYVNYNLKAASADGLTIPAEDYVIEEGGAY